MGSLVNNLTANGRLVADLNIQNFALRPTLGAYELVLALYLTVRGDPVFPQEISIAGVRVSLAGDIDIDVGIARPDQPIQFATTKTAYSLSDSLAVSLIPSQLALLEDLRDGRDLTLDLVFFGRCVDRQGRHRIDEKIRYSVPQSEWIKILELAGVNDTLVLEVPLPADPGGAWEGVLSSLRKGANALSGGDYSGCIATCRHVIEGVEPIIFREGQRFNAVLARLGGKPTDMNKGEREAALWAAVRHYTHLAHHGPTKGGEGEFSRREARMIYTLTATLLRSAMSRQVESERAEQPL